MTRSLCEDPYALFEIWAALTFSVPLISVSITGKGYDFEAAAETLENLHEAMEQRRPGSAADLQRMLPDGTGVASLGKLIHSNLTAIIAISWNPSQGAHHMDAVVNDIVKRMQKNTRLSRALRRSNMHLSRQSVSALRSSVRRTSNAASETSGRQECST